ncbi:GDSL esterase/lipase at1g33811 [Phtheirospermum japonicum]|uniref:GDSL esterase/lipase at1g33811 n=1 Tax=Phtheirospermum japonicum TaxID=374723 RepID=A0A830D319_9LAMI|nr:GDSL esterase/lipase at1g33811 [Phtheirospermum japonicum]
MPYGIDFPQGATGRFTNGRTFVDILAQLLGFPNYIPPYARTRGRALLQGANYASGASGIRDEAGNNLVCFLFFFLFFLFTPKKFNF